MKRSHPEIILFFLLGMFVLIFADGCNTFFEEQHDQPAHTTPAGRETPAPSTDQVLPRLRIKNAGAQDIKDLVVIFPEDRILFGDVPAGTTTEYQPAPQGVYNYAAYEFAVEGGTVMQPVIDWVGESPRPGQSYTYVLELDTSRPVMQRIHLIAVQADANP